MHFAANSEVHKFTKQVWGLSVGGKMASPVDLVDLLRPPISEVRLETTQGLCFGISWNALLSGKPGKPSAKFVGMDSMSLIHFEVHYNYVGGPPPSLWRSTVQWTLMDWHVAESYPSRDSHPVRLKRTRQRSDYSANLQAYVLCLESLCGSHQPIRDFSGKCIVDAGWDQEML